MFTISAEQVEYSEYEPGESESVPENEQFFEDVDCHFKHHSEPSKVLG